MDTDRRDLYRSAMDEFFAQTLDERLSADRIATAPGCAEAVLESALRDVPAYRDFVHQHPDTANICHDGRMTLDRAPRIDKQSYIRRYPLPMLCRGGRLERSDTVAVSSGSTGEPAIWPRSVADELGIAWRFEQILHDSFHADERTTLAVVCFALGTWVGGMFTAACCRHVASKGYPLMVVTPGNNRDEIIRMVSELGPHFEQVVLLGYPPYLKDVIDTGVARGVEWPRFRIKLVMAGEVFSEEWRSLVGRRTGSESPCFDSASMYGTADAGVLGNETPLSISLRRWLARSPESVRVLFGESRLPTLVQYDPCSRYFEVVDGRLVFTGDNGIPLVRYDILDSGGIIPYAEMLAFARGRGFDPVEALKSESGPGVRGIRPMPFVYVFGRSDFTVSFYGANVYPENVSIGLEQPGICEHVTGKFVLQSEVGEDQNRFLSLIVELAPGGLESDSLCLQIAETVCESLCRVNSEFANYVPVERRVPRVTLMPTGHPQYFPVGVKHRYTRRS